MREELLKLLEVQAVDNEVDGLLLAKKELPSRIAALKGEIGDRKRHLETQLARKEELEGLSHQLERALNAASDDLKKHQERLYEVKTNREYDALMREIDGARTRISEHENGIVQAMMELETIDEQREGEVMEFETIEGERGAEIAELSKQLSSLERKLAFRKRKKKKVSSDVSRRVLSSYERIRKGKKGIAVASIDRNACGGCFTQIPPQTVVEIRRNTRIILCESCGRILVWDDRDGSAGG